MKRVQEYTNDGSQAKHACFRVALLLVVILNVYTHGEFVLKSYDMNNSPSSPLRGDFVIGWYRYQPIYPKRYSKYNTMPVHISTQHSKHKEITAENNQSADIFIESTLKRPKMIADYQFAERLRQSQKNDSFPLVNDIIVMGNNKKWIFYVIMNNGNALPAYQKLRNMNVKLVCGNQTIRNSFKVGKEDNIRLLKFVVNDALLSNTVSLIDGATSWKYISLPFQVLPVQPRRKVAICAYISDYNTANEIKSFLAFYLIQKVDTIILYCAVNFNFFYNLLKKEIENTIKLLRCYVGVNYYVNGSEELLHTAELLGIRAETEVLSLQERVDSAENEVGMATDIMTGISINAARPENLYTEESMQRVQAGQQRLARAHQELAAARAELEAARRLEEEEKRFRRMEMDAREG